MSKAILENRLGAAEEKLSVFRALSNPSYIMLTSADPIMAAFRLSHLLRQHGAADRGLKTEYAALDLEVQRFAVHLIGLCQTSEEVELILSRKEGCNFFGAFPYTRLVMAMDMKQKEFVAHAYVQQMLEASWIGHWHAWRRYRTARKYFTALVRVLLLPWTIIATLVLPTTECGKLYRLPVNRMLSHIASYALFLVALAVENNTDNSRWPRDATARSWCLKGAIAVYATSYVFRAISLAMVQGPGRYVRVPWNVYDCATLALLAVTISCWWLTYASPPTDDDGEPLERKYLRSADPTLVAEGLLAVVTVMSFLRLLFLCQLNFVLGPMQVSLGKMTVDFVQFAVLFAIIIVAFVAGLCTLYQYYEGMTRTDPVTGAEVTQDESFVSAVATLKTLFWSIFCMAPSTAGRVVIGTEAGDGGEFDEAMANNHYFTQFVGTVLYTVFVSVSVLIMLNMLIATMSNTYQRVTDNAYVEWVFGRTQVYLSFSVHSELPPPFNLIPTWHCLSDLGGCVAGCFKASAYGVANFVSSKEYTMKEDSEKEFRGLMSELSRRYYRRKLSSDDVKRWHVCG